MKKFIKYILILSTISVISNLSAHSLKDSIKSDDRTPAYKARDVFRHPYETLTFFGIEPDMTVVELNPGGGWYTEILANYIHYPGTLIAAQGNYYLDRFKKKIDSNSMYGRVELVGLDSKLADPNSVDAVITFRNLHNWLGPKMESIFKNSFVALKPGGIFGVVEHRAEPGTGIDLMKSSGYVTEELAIEVAIKSGFELVAKSEINANSKDTKNHPKGVWTLPPSLRLKDVDREKYSSIGESDRMTLLFRKPL
ncbi:MAG: methyltransferase [Gammaproteobacteria bacterium]|nr:methyltransferase [Gammaproteobacteria bacterium]|tara:strand:+ start:284 stop:1042 length:759 start_codon:yes stop_codon:yes gene_type:complete